MDADDVPHHPGHLFPRLSLPPVVAPDHVLHIGRGDFYELPGSQVERSESVIHKLIEPLIQRYPLSPGAV